MKQMGLFPTARLPGLPWYSAPVRIGNYDWRLKRVETLTMLATRTERYLNYEWSPAGHDDWRPPHEWPGYDNNNGGTLSLPQGLRRLYEQNPELVAWCREER